MGHFLLSTSSGGGPNTSNDDRDILERAIAIFRQAVNASEIEDEGLVPATRGLAVALRRRRLMVRSAAVSEQQASTTAEGLLKNNSDDDNNMMNAIEDQQASVVHWQEVQYWVSISSKGEAMSESWAFV